MLFERYLQILYGSSYAFHPSSSSFLIKLRIDIQTNERFYVYKDKKIEAGCLSMFVLYYNIPMVYYSSLKLTDV